MFQLCNEKKLIIYFCPKQFLKIAALCVCVCVCVFVCVCVCMFVCVYFLSP